MVCRVAAGPPPGVACAWLSSGVNWKVLLFATLGCYVEAPFCCLLGGEAKAEAEEPPYLFAPSVL